MKNKVVDGHFKIIRRIGSGSFGKIYLGEDTNTNQPVAIKTEPSTVKNGGQLEFEFRVLNTLKGSPQIPCVYSFTVKGEMKFLVMDLLGKSVEQLFKSCRFKFSIKTVLALTIQMLSAIENLHQLNFIHRDIKPDNFLIGTGSKKNQLYLIDFGLSKQYRDPPTKKHITFESNRGVFGTARYSSLHSLKGLEQSRRDDMEALAYVFIYLLRGSLPWMNFSCKNRKEERELNYNMKVTTDYAQILKGYPKEYLNYYHSVHDLKFDEEPNYSLYRQMFIEAYVREGYIWDFSYDWDGSTSLGFDLISPEKPITKSEEKQTDKKQTDRKLKIIQESLNTPKLYFKPKRKIEFTTFVLPKRKIQPRLRKYQASSSDDSSLKEQQPTE